MWGNNNRNNRRNDERGAGGPILRDPLAHRKRLQQFPYSVDSSSNDRSNVSGSFSFPPTPPENPFQAFNTDFSPFPPACNEMQFPPPVANFTNFDLGVPPPPLTQPLLPFSMGTNFAAKPPTTTTSAAPEPLLPTPPSPWAAASNAGNRDPQGTMMQSPFNNFQSFDNIDTTNQAAQLHTPTPPPPLMSFTMPANDSLAVFTNDEQPPFAFPKEPVHGGPRFRNKKNEESGPGIRAKLLEMAFGNGSSNSPSTGHVTHSPCTTNHKHNNIEVVTIMRNPKSNGGVNLAGQNNFSRPIEPLMSLNPHQQQVEVPKPPEPNMITNPFYDERSKYLKQSTYGSPRTRLPDWLVEDDDEVYENSRQSFGGKGKKRQEFDWKGSSFLNKLNPPSYQNRINKMTPAPSPNLDSNNRHPKSCVRNPAAFNNGNENAINANQDQSVLKKVPLLPTPKLVPYPPPPLPKKLNDSVSNSQKGILKPLKSYSNFVKEGFESSSDDVAVVPYEDDGEDVEFIEEVEGSQAAKSSNEAHDFFSEKMVQYFTSLLAGKTTEIQLNDLLTRLVLSPDYLSTRVQIVRNLHLVLSETFKKCSLHPYGADFIGIGNNDDSVNVFVDLNGKQGCTSNIEGFNIEASQLTKENVEELLNLIQEDKNHKFFGQIVRRTNFDFYRRNLPVISFIHSDTQVRCNIRLDNYLLVQEAKVIQFLCSLDLRLPPLLALLRYWSSVHKVLDTPEEDTKNRFITLLLLFFLAQKKIIPTMEHLQSLSVKKEYFENMDISFCDDLFLVPANENDALEDKSVFTLSTLSLLKQFFSMFATAKFEDEVVSLWKAEFIPKENFSPDVEGKLLPPELRKKYRYGANGKLRDKRLDCTSVLCIQDFQDLTENLSQAVAQYDVNKFQVECDIAHKKIDEIMIGSKNLMDLFVITEYADEASANVKGFFQKLYTSKD